MTVTFTQAVDNQEARTDNGMKARKSTANALVDLFYNIGASRGKDITKQFIAAYVQDKNLAVRIAQWARDARGGAGERELFRQILTYLEMADPDMASALLKKVPEIGRWDDIFVFKTSELKTQAFAMLGDALRERNGLAAKWTPRQGPLAVEIRKFFGMSPKFYRKSLVELTNVVEQQMCSKDWDNINFSHVPSLAHARYKKAFGRNTQKYAEYIQSLVKGDDAKVKVNAGAVYPYDVLKGLIGFAHYGKSYTQDELSLIEKQWEAMENFIGDADILPMVDVSGSMTSVPAGSNTSCMEVAVSLGLYCADKNKGKFKDTFLTFSGEPELLKLQGNIVQKVHQMETSTWGMNTDIKAALSKVLKTAKDGKVPQAEMPKMLLIFSDMQFDQCTDFDHSAMESFEHKYAEAGYELPQIVFWNLNASGNVPVKADKSGVALVSGFSPAVMKSLLNSDPDNFTPEAIMMQTIMVPRYDI